MNSFDDVAFVDTARNIALNDLGQIALAANLTNGQQTIFVLTPIPEPSTYALMLAGLGTLAWIAGGSAADHRAVEWIDTSERTGSVISVLGLTALSRIRGTAFDYRSPPPTNHYPTRRNDIAEIGIPKTEPHPC